MRNRPVLLATLAGLTGAVIGAAAMRRVAQRSDATVDLWTEAAAALPGVPTVADDDRADDDQPDTDLRRRAREKADAVAAARRAGHPSERGEARASVGFDLNRLDAGGNALEPVVQYLTYIQSRRGDDSSLLFIRYDDIDAMAELDGEPSEHLLERLDQLGVVVSAN